MRMNINEAISIINDSGLILERIKKYRTTSDERWSRDNQSDYDNSYIKSKMWKIVKEEGMEEFVRRHQYL